MLIQRGDVFFVRLEPTKGREINDKRRPVVVVSINYINFKPSVVTVIPGTKWAPSKKIFMNEVRVDPSSTNGLSNPTLFLSHQIRAIDQSRFDQALVGRLSSQELGSIEKAIGRCLGLP
ncbi:MAG TPA: growth inhibitor PemK [Planctomycetales bacterium]|jgi:mRNA-degrading endonuclease toxin of MazEF toxin-antitoxin module|nr:growth inhibitor PemK [Planctomycetales bacterium]